MPGSVAMICESPLLIHRDGSMSCQVPNCADARSPHDIERALARHGLRVSCDDPSRPRCTRCRPPSVDGRVPTTNPIRSASGSHDVGIPFDPP